MTWSKCERFNLKGLVSWPWSFEIFPNRSMQFCIYFPLCFLLFSFSGHVFTWIPLSNDFGTSLEEICYAALLHCMTCLTISSNQIGVSCLAWATVRSSMKDTEMIFPRHRKSFLSSSAGRFYTLHTQCHSYLISAWISTNSRLFAKQWLEGAKSVAKKKIKKNENVQSLNFSLQKLFDQNWRLNSY